LKLSVIKKKCAGEGFELLQIKIVPIIFCNNNRVNKYRDK